jgi:muramoyltetrapeptide carboxypeptidase
MKSVEIKTRTIPAPLAKGERIAVIAPASAVNDERLDAARTLLEAHGFSAVIAQDIKDSYGYLAGRSDQARATALEQAFADPTIKGIICARGGYGTMRILPLVNWNVIRSNPKFFCGFSDITALHIAIHKEAQMVTYHGGPMPRWENLQANDWNDASFFNALRHGAEIGTIHAPPQVPAETLIDGVVEGVIEGGNLTLLAALAGTPWQLDLKNKILLVEDVSESPYRIDRSLTQLLLSGSLDGVTGIVFGHSPSCEKKGDDEGFTLREVIMDRLGSLKVPLVYGFPCGHSEFRATLPLGMKVTLDAGKGTLTYSS